MEEVEMCPTHHAGMDVFVYLRVFVRARDVHERGDGAHSGPLELVLLLVLLLHGVCLDLGGAGQLEGLHQLVQLLQHGTRAQLRHPEYNTEIKEEIRVTGGGISHLATIRYVSILIS